MKHLLSIASLLVIIIAFRMPAQAQQKQLQNLTSKEYQTQFNQLVAQGYRPVKVWSKTLQVFDYQPGETPRPGYWASFEKKPGTTPWAARHGISAAAYQTEFNTWTSRGYMPTDINVACVNGVVSYCVIFDKIPNPKPWQARHGLNAATYQNFNSDLIRQGYTRRITSSCQTPGGPVYAALWMK